MAEQVGIIGSSGLGKSEGGLRAALGLSVPFSDTDACMAANGIDVPHFVKTDPDGFRRVEARTFTRLVAETSGIIATGAGIVSTEVGFDALRAAAIPLIWLRGPFDVAAQRARNDRTMERPLFEDIAKARELFDERQDLYAGLATYKVDAVQSREQVANDIARIFRAA